MNLSSILDITENEVGFSVFTFCDVRILEHTDLRPNPSGKIR